MAKVKKKMGRPRVNIDLKTVKKLAYLQCTYEEISAFLGISKGTLSKRKDFTDTFKEGSEGGKVSLRRSQFKLADRSPAMCIWLGKQYLNQRDTNFLPFDDKPDEPTTKQLFAEMEKSTPTPYAIPATNNKRKIQSSSSGKAKRKNGTG